MSRMLGHAPRVVDSLGGAAAVLRWWVAAVHEPHHHAHDVVPLFHEQGRRDGAVDAAAERDDSPWSISPSCVLYSGLIWRSLSTMPGRMPGHVVHVFLGVLLARGEPEAAVGDLDAARPRASSTWEAPAKRRCRPIRWRPPMPRMSRLSRIDSPSMYSKTKLALLGRRWVGWPGQMGVRNRGQDAVDQPVPELRRVRLLGLQVLVGQLQRRGQADDAGQVLGAGPAIALLAAALQLGPERRALADVAARPTPLGP